MEKTTTENNNKTLWGLGGAGLLLLIAFFTKDKWMGYLPKLGKGSGSGASSSSAKSSSKVKTSPEPLNENKTLQNGDRGESVEALQKLLNKLLGIFHPGDPKLVEDGIFGSKTEAALQKIAGVKSASIAELKKAYADPLAGKGGQTSQSSLIFFQQQTQPWAQS